MPIAASISRKALLHPPRKPGGTDGDWWPYFELHRGLYQPPQSRGWTCSACSIDWVFHSTGLNPESNREWVVGQLGYPDCINENVGLRDTACAVDLLSEYAPTNQEWVGWDRAWELCSYTTGLLNSTTWQHFVAIRGTQGGALWVANSAIGWMGIGETIDRGQFERWSGSWQIVWLVH